MELQEQGDAGRYGKQGSGGTCSTSLYFGRGLPRITHIFPFPFTTTVKTVRRAQFYRLRTWRWSWLGLADEDGGQVEGTLVHHDSVSQFGLGPTGSYQGWLCSFMAAIGEGSLKQITSATTTSFCFVTVFQLGQGWISGVRSHRLSSSGAGLEHTPVRFFLVVNHVSRGRLLNFVPVGSV
ncbi:unnamed protein product [Cuscuta europaea]|uniref:Uncharacterized protein n=1 Tax=Cuscuta europaea TaxID=41803 RepID=A0A9P0YGK9_CUSEU|nr:unnamed protein product [Cuscuta europaea]